MESKTLIGLYDFENRLRIFPDVDGRFKDFDGAIKYEAQHPADSSVQFTVQAASINTGNDDRDKHLKSPDFFDAAKFPTLSFTSTKVVAKGNNAFDVTGNLTIRGVTKTVLLDVDRPAGVIKDPWGMQRSAVSATTKINRQDFGVKWNQTLDSGGLAVSDEVNITLDVEMVIPPAKK